MEAETITREDLRDLARAHGVPRGRNLNDTLQNLIKAGVVIPDTKAELAEAIKNAIPDVVVVTKRLTHCGQCRHKDHSGGYTPGGPKPICQHSATCAARGSDWKNRVIEGVKIPVWCPLRSGAEY